MNEDENSIRKEEQGTSREPCSLKDMKQELTDDEEFQSHSG